MPILAEATPRVLADPGRCSSPLLVVAHPGHELRVHGWMARARPRVCVLTDGSGSAGEGRLESTTRVLRRLRARRGGVYGAMSDRAIYAAILGGDHERFLALATALAEVLVADETDCVVGDAVEGYNPSHDVCRLVINAAVRIAAARTGREIGNWDFLLVGAPNACAEAVRERAYWLELDDPALQRKLEAAQGYPELAGEVDAAIQRWGTAPFRVECIRPADAADRYAWPAGEKPYYETFGEQRVAEGVYKDVIRFRDHVMPLADALWAHAERA